MHISSDEGNYDPRMDVQRLIQEEELPNMCIGSLMTSWSPCLFVIVSTLLPSEQDLSWQYQLFKKKQITDTYS